MSQYLSEMFRRKSYRVNYICTFKPVRDHCATGRYVTLREITPCNSWKEFHFSQILPRNYCKLSYSLLTISSGERIPNWTRFTVRKDALESDVAILLWFTGARAKDLQSFPAPAATCVSRTYDFPAILALHCPAPPFPPFLYR